MKPQIKINTLKDYLYFNQIKYQDFAAKCNIGASMLTNIANGKTMPRTHTALSIEKATDGVISAESIIRFSFEKRMKAIFGKDNK